MSDRNHPQPPNATPPIGQPRNTPLVDNVGETHFNQRHNTVMTSRTRTRIRELELQLAEIDASAPPAREANAARRSRLQLELDSRRLALEQLRNEARAAQAEAPVRQGNPFGAARPSDAPATRSRRRRRGDRNALSRAHPYHHQPSNGTRAGTGTRTHEESADEGRADEERIVQPSAAPTIRPGTNAGGQDITDFDWERLLVNPASHRQPGNTSGSGTRARNHEEPSDEHPFEAEPSIEEEPVRPQTLRGGSDFRSSFFQSSHVPQIPQSPRLPQIPVPIQAANVPRQDSPADAGSARDLAFAPSSRPATPQQHPAPQHAFFERRGSPLMGRVHPNAGDRGTRNFAPQPLRGMTFTFNFENSSVNSINFTDSCNPIFHHSHNTPGRDGPDDGGRW
ncbi:hypothetical protein BDV95DRAFT_670631 [Massariosphaeria phaeospora]|uniref:Uncharacterized protein n=1 Tax=Massariosphaeria phaeospora TaxID=100035 RepID=A0A7C8I8X6_9PLEO|nr:hypothetical protein BDV95DRAFT_670631 [Massariosphaeria phaeospora]